MRCSRFKRNAGSTRSVTVDRTPSAPNEQTAASNSSADVGDDEDGDDEDDMIGDSVTGGAVEEDGTPDDAADNSSTCPSA